VKPYFPRKELCYFYKKARTATFICADFEVVMGEMTRAGDVVYCDPPYVPLSETANFTSYSAGKFNLEQQKRLAELAEGLGNGVKGVPIPVLISNHNTRFTRDVYTNAKLKRFSVQRYISCDGANRNKAKELLAIYGGK
jgi:DNA adenine methylase